MSPPRIRVLVVDDSALARSAIMRSLSQDPSIEVAGVAADAYEAREKIAALEPDVMTLDLEMPRMDGLTFLKILQKHHPLPVIVISSFTPEGSTKALEALEAGAFEVLGKPGGSDLAELSPRISDLVKAAAASHRSRRRTDVPAAVRTPREPADAETFPDGRIVVIGASTGGVEALRDLLPQLPAGMPPIAVVQHIPTNFSRLMAERLNSLCAFEVREAREGDELANGLCLVAPGDFHLMLATAGRRYKVRLTQSPPVHHCRPSVDVLFRSAVECGGANAVAVLLTGMGRDGARGMQELRASGAHTIAQDRASSVVYGMPAAAVALGAVVQELPLSRIPEAILGALGKPVPA